MKRIKFTLKDLETMRDILDSTLLEMVEGLATNTEKCSVIIPLVKINELIKREGN
jgi:hypothetical protein